MNRSILTLPHGIQPRLIVKPKPKSDSKQRKTTTSFLRLRIREQNNKKREDAPVKEKPSKTDQKKFLYRNKLSGKLSDESLDALMVLKNDLIKKGAPQNQLDYIQQDDLEKDKELLEKMDESMEESLFESYYQPQPV